MINVNREKLLAERERLIALLKNKEFDDNIARLVRDDLRHVEKELQELNVVFKNDLETP